MGALSALLAFVPWIGAISGLAATLGAGGLGLLVIVGAGLARRFAPPLIIAGAALIAVAGLYQAAYGHGVRVAERRQLERAIAAERTRAAMAERITATDAAAAATDRATLATANRRLQESLNALKSDPNRGRACLDERDARGLQRL